MPRTDMGGKGKSGRRGVRQGSRDQGDAPNYGGRHKSSLTSEKGNSRRFKKKIVQKKIMRKEELRITPHEMKKRSNDLTSALPWGLTFAGKEKNIESRMLGAKSANVYRRAGEQKQEKSVRNNEGQQRGEGKKEKLAV